MDMFEDGIRVQFHSSDDKLKLTPLKASLIFIEFVQYIIYDVVKTTPKYRIVYSIYNVGMYVIALN